MMMISNNRSGLRSVRNSQTRLVGFLCVLLVVGMVAWFRAPLGAGLVRVLSPVLQARFGSAPADAQMLSVALSDRDVLYKENVQLKARLGRTGEVRRIVAGVLLRPPATPYDTLVIDAGTAEGVTLQAVVSAGGSVVLGTVFEVYEHSSRVRLYSAPGESYDALLQYGKNTEHIALVLKGQGGGSMHAEVPSGISVTVGDKAFLPGLAGGLSAVVTSIDQNEGASFTTVHFTLPVNLYTLRYIEVWKQPSYDTR